MLFLNALTFVFKHQQASPIKVDEVDNIADARSPSTPHCGPIEAKVLQGSDGRNYVLEVMRLTPRDANYVTGEKGTGKVSLLEKADKDLAVTYVLRPELVSLFVQRKLHLARQGVMQEASATQKKLIEEKKAAMVSIWKGIFVQRTLCCRSKCQTQYSFVLMSACVFVLFCSFPLLLRAGS